MELTPTRRQNFEQHASTRKISTAPSYSHDVIISFSTTPSYLLWSSPLSLSRSALHLVLSSLSRSPSVTTPVTTPCRSSAPAVHHPGGRSDDHPTSCATTAPLRLPPRATEVFLLASCPGCLPNRLFLEHIALGYFPISELATAPTL
jgi:hypothetical protein